jgi:hypothetical protein
VDWTGWESGDILHASDPPQSLLDQPEVQRRVAVGFRRIAIDWTEGDEWAEALLHSAFELGFRGELLAKANALRGRCALVSVADDPGPTAHWVQFILTANPSTLNLHYEPRDAETARRDLAHKLGVLLGYEFSPREENLPQ